MILTSVVLAVIPPIFYMWAEDWGELIIWAVMYASAFAIFMPTRNAWIADLVEPGDRVKAYSFLNMAFPLGSILGPLLGGFLVDWSGWAILFLVAAFVHGLCFLPTLAIGEAYHDIYEKEKTSSDTTKRGEIRVFLLLFLLQFLFGFGFGTIPIYLTERFQTTATQIGFFTSIGFGLTAVLAQIPAPALLGRLGRGTLIFYCCLALPLSLFLWPYSRSYLELMILRMVATLAWSMTWSSTASLLMESAPRSRRGLFSGLVQSSIMLGFTVGPTLAGWLWEEIGYNAPLYASSLIFAITIPTALLLKVFYGRVESDEE